MGKAEFGAIFYSKNNVELAYKVKKACWNAKITVVNSSDLAELMVNMQEQMGALLFIDCFTVELNDTLTELLNGVGAFASTLIFLAGDNNMPKYEHIKMFPTDFAHRIHVDKMEEELENLKEKFLFNHEKLVYKFYNIAEVNAFLTKQLIDLGFLPKHSGFCLIKQVVEYAIINNRRLGALSTEIYPVVACKNKTHEQNIERNIRNAITYALKSGKFTEEGWKALAESKKITNRAFISYLLERVLIDYKLNHRSGNNVG